MNSETFYVTWRQFRHHEMKSDIKKWNFLGEIHSFFSWCEPTQDHLSTENDDILE